MWRKFWLMQPFKWKTHDRHVSHSWPWRLKKVQTKIVGSALGHRQIRLSPQNSKISVRLLLPSPPPAAGKPYESLCAGNGIVWDKSLHWQSSKSHDLEELPPICPSSCLFPLQSCSLAWPYHLSVRSVNLNFIYSSNPVLPVQDARGHYRDMGGISSWMNIHMCFVSDFWLTLSTEKKRAHHGSEQDYLMSPHGL